jgi:hypothetical protein
LLLAYQHQLCQAVKIGVIDIFYCCIVRFT